MPRKRWQSGFCPELVLGEAVQVRDCWGIGRAISICYSRSQFQTISLEGLSMSVHSPRHVHNQKSKQHESVQSWAKHAITPKTMLSRLLVGTMRTNPTRLCGMTNRGFCASSPSDIYLLTRATTSSRCSTPRQLPWSMLLRSTSGRSARA